MRAISRREPAWRTDNVATKDSRVSKYLGERTSRASSFVPKDGELSVECNDMYNVGKFDLTLEPRVSVVDPFL